MFIPGKVLDLKLSMPFLIKQTPDGKTGPFGDMLLDVSRSWGTLNMFAAGLTLNFPTGYSTIMSDDTTFLFRKPGGKRSIRVQLYGQVMGLRRTGELSTWELRIRQDSLQSGPPSMGTTPTQTNHLRHQNLPGGTRRMGRA